MKPQFGRWRFLVACALTRTALGQEPVPIGSEFVISSYTSVFKQGPKVAMSRSGDFVVAWTDLAPQTRANSVRGAPPLEVDVFAKRYDPYGGSPAGLVMIRYPQERGVRDAMSDVRLGEHSQERLDPAWQAQATV
jgi:hypothetical protein